MFGELFDCAGPLDRQRRPDHVLELFSVAVAGGVEDPAEFRSGDHRRQVEVLSTDRFLDLLPRGVETLGPVGAAPGDRRLRSGMAMGKIGNRTVGAKSIRVSPWLVNSRSSRRVLRRIFDVLGVGPEVDRRSGRSASRHATG